MKKLTATNIGTAGGFLIGIPVAVGVGAIFAALDAVMVGVFFAALGAIIGWVAGGDPVQSSLRFAGVTAAATFAVSFIYMLVAWHSAVSEKCAKLRLDAALADIEDE